MSTNDKYSREAKEKLKELAESIDFAMMATNLSKQPIHVIPMSTKKVDDEGCIWFLSGKNSDHNTHINQNPATQLMYSKPGDFEFMTVYGKSTITQDKAVLEELYESTDDNWFEGVKDPNLTAIKVTPSEAYYWDSKDGKLISMLKMGVGAITGDKPDLSEEGRLLV